MAKKDEIFQKLKSILGEQAVATGEPAKTGVAVTAIASPANFKKAISACREAEFFLESMSGLDFTDTMEVVYHLNCYEPSSRVAVRICCAKGGSLPTVSDIFDSALWQERETWEFFGIGFSGHPELKPLLLPEDIDADYHPHRKTFGKANAYCKREEIYG